MEVSQMKSRHDAKASSVELQFVCEGKEAKLIVTASRPFADVLQNLCQLFSLPPGSALVVVSSSGGHIAKETADLLKADGAAAVPRWVVLRVAALAALPLDNPVSTTAKRKRKRRLQSTPLELCQKLDELLSRPSADQLWRGSDSALRELRLSESTKATLAQMKPTTWDRKWSIWRVWLLGKRQWITDYNGGFKSCAEKANELHAQMKLQPRLLPAAAAATDDEDKEVSEEGKEPAAKRRKTEQSDTASWLGAAVARFHADGLGLLQRDDTQPDMLEYGFRLVTRAALAGHAGAMNSLAWAYQQGRGVAQDQCLALTWWRKAAAAGDTNAMIRLGSALVQRTSGSGTGAADDSDAREGVSWLRQASETAALADFWLAGAYRDGVGVGKDSKQAAALYRRAADAGIPEAMCELGTCYLNGAGVDKDYKQAAEWLRHAATAGDADGMYRLALLYQDGLGVDRNPKQAFDWLHKSATAGCVDAMWAEGCCFRDGTGVVPNAKAALEMLRKAARADHVPAMVAVADLFASRPDLEDGAAGYALYWLETAATRGHSDAMFKLGVLEEKDVNKAASWFRRAVAVDGHLEATYRLGKLLLLGGPGLAQDVKEGLRFIMDAAQRGHREALYDIGCAYTTGTGVDRDAVRAVQSFEKAALLKHPDAMRRLGNAYEIGCAVTADAKVAVEWYSQSAAAGCALAMAFLGLCFRDGIGVPAADQAAAARWLASARAARVAVPEDAVEANKWRQAALLTALPCEHLFVSVAPSSSSSSTVV